MEVIKYNLIIEELLEAQNIDFDSSELKVIGTLFFENQINETVCFNFFKLILQTRNLLFKYNLHLIYEPFSLKASDLNWQSFKITNGKQFILEVFYDKNYSLTRVEDHISALYF